MRKFLLSLFVIAFFLCSCSNQADLTDTVFTDVDFTLSPYKHINNGGLDEDAALPYNIDAITGATLTVEGPAVVASIPLSMRELENRNEGLFRAIYRDEAGQFIYEGLDLNYLLKSMVEGDNGIILTQKAYYAELKDSNRATIARFTLDEVNRASTENRPVLLAYGIGTTNEKKVAPFVFDAANENERSEGYIEALDNDDGCLKLVYDLQRYGENAAYTRFTNVAYVYICEETEPGFKHTLASGNTYADSRYLDYIVSFRGEALGAEINLSLKQLEELAAYDEEGHLMEGGLGYADSYSLANNAYWYVNEYEGLDLYKLLLYLGMADAESMGQAAARTTLVSFIANDGVAAQESFSVDTLSYPEVFGFYNKNAADLDDGSYKPTNADLVKSGYPVLLAYGVNRYPYTISKTDEGYLSGLGNSGGPLRVVFGKTQYNHANGSNQVQYLKEVIVGADTLYNTHKYTNVPEQQALAENTLDITVVAEDGRTLSERTMSVGDIEDLIYGANVGKEVKKAALVKGFYQTLTTGKDIYEGVDLPWFLLETLGLPGTNGMITFYGGSGELTLSLNELLQSPDRPILAFAKNGAPMVSDARGNGYVEERALTPLLGHEPAAYRVQNSGGPLAVLTEIQSLWNVTGLRIILEPDDYAHINPPFSDHAGDSVRFYGEGLEQEALYTVAELESKQTQAQTLDYSLLDEAGTLTKQRYRGLSLYGLFTEIGIKSNAGDVTIYSADGSSITLPLAQVKKRIEGLYVMLAYGEGIVGADMRMGRALLPEYGGPLQLIVPQQKEGDINTPLCLGQVIAVEVSANKIDTWGHRISSIYEEFLDHQFTLTVKNNDSEWSQTFTLAQLEEQRDLITREDYTVLDIGECEGLDVWKFVRKFAGAIPGLNDPVAVTVYAADGYKNDLLSVFYKEGLELGVADEYGQRKPLLLAYALNGYPLVDNESHEGYTGLAGNSAGPLRVVAEGNQGASVKYVNKLVVTITGSGPIVNPREITL